MIDTLTGVTGTVPWFAGFALAILVSWGAFVLFVNSWKYWRATKFERDRMRLAWRIARQWRRLAPNVGLARIDENTKGVKDWQGNTKKSITVVPKLKAVPEPWGVRAHIQTIPKVGITEFEKATLWLADAWGCEEVQVKRVKSGLIEVRGIVGNPLDDHQPYAWPTGQEWVLPMGHNPWMRQIEIPLRELSGIKIAGMPGYGKTMLMLAWYAVLADRPEVQPVIFDGKTADPRYGDWAEVAHRAMFITGDNPEAANQRLTDLVRMLKDRPGRLVEERGTHKFWKHGPTCDNPLVPVFMDECHNYIDAGGLRGKEKELIESNQRLMRTVTKEGRGLGFLPIIGTQKQTADAIPTAVRDNCEVGICFPVATLDAAEAALGSAIRKDEANQPTQFVDKEANAGLCVVIGLPGLRGRYDRVRVGDLDEDDITRRVQTAGGLRRDLIPAAAPTIRDATETAGVPLQKKTTRRKTA
ncbi:hypothetical protein [Streptomyces chrestomyceticus]|uniref:hypothetical protein n=1 Tax=Streptomyces chrestomyceticus TaxID=68185 RepID=UPI0033D398A9